VIDTLLQADTYNLILKIAFAYVVLIFIGGFIMKAP
jgi:hypothetical protein